MWHLTSREEGKKNKQVTGTAHMHITGCVFGFSLLFFLFLMYGTGTCGLSGQCKKRFPACVGRHFL